MVLKVKYPLLELDTAEKLDMLLHAALPLCGSLVPKPYNVRRFGGGLL